MKTQTVRLLDVLLVGPLTLLAGRKLADDNPGLGGALMALGTATVLYNGANYLSYAQGEHIVGGRAAGRKAWEFDPEQLRRGIRVEREHTVDDDVAREIAMDHLTEDPAYYDKLLRAGL